MILPIVYYGDPVLRKKSVKVVDFSADLEKLVNDMIETMDSVKGVGLAANQVGVLLRVFVIRPEIRTPSGGYDLGEPEVYINPELFHPSQEKEFFNEGCLSFPGLHLDIERPRGIHIKAQDLQGNWREEKVEGFKARELMHENDHLNGTCFIDRYKGSKQDLECFLQKIKKIKK